MLLAVDQGQEIRDMERYIRFAMSQREIEREAGKEPSVWPGWKFKHGTIIATPSVTVLNTMYSTGHGEVRTTGSNIDDECDCQGWEWGSVGREKRCPDYSTSIPENLDWG